MKKLMLLTLALAFAAGADAKSVSNPLYMPSSGQIMSDTGLSYSKITSGGDKKTYNLTERLSYNFTDRLQLGAYLGYQKINPGEVKDFTNPGVFGYFRILDNLVILDVGGEIEHNFLKNDITGKDRYTTYSAAGRAGVDLGTLSLGGKLTLRYNDAEHADNTKDTIVNAFIINDIFDVVGIGAEGTYAVYGVSNGSVKAYELLGRFDVNPIPSRLGAVVYGGFESYDGTSRRGYKVGGRLKFVL